MNRNKIFLGMALLTLGVTSCKEKDLFNPNVYQEQLKQAFPVEDIDPQQTWSTIESAEVTIEVDKKAGEVYEVRIYDKNPISYKGTLNLLGKGTVYNGGYFRTKINYPLASKLVYVALLDPSNYMSVYPQTITNNWMTIRIGGKSSSTARIQAPLKQGSHDFVFPDAPDVSNFKTAIPEDAKNENMYYETQSGNYFVEPGDNQINVWSGNANLYFAAGTYNITSLGLNNNTNFYLLPGANVTMPGDIKYGNVNFYIAESATLNSNINANVHFFNRGTVNAGSITLYSSYNAYWDDPSASDGTMYNEGIINVTGTYHTDDRCQTVNANMLTANIVTVDEDAQLLNKGTMTVTGELGVKNTNSLFINEGTATAGSVGVEGSADFYNDGTMTVKGTTTVNSNSCTWHNDGTYNTNKYIYQAGSTDVINNCKLYVEDTFYLGLGDTDQNRFKLNAGGSVVTKYFEFSGPGFLDMGSGSLFKVTESAYMAITKDVYGIYGPATGDYAVFQAKQIMRRSDVDANQGFVANYFNHLYVATDSHFNFGYSDLSDEQEAAGQVGGQPYYRLDAASGATMTTFNGADVHLLDNGCGAVYDGEPEEHEPVAQEFSLRYCFEDNFPDWGDYDFNDVVLTVTPTIQGAAVKLKVSIDAVGATKSIGAAIRIVGVKPEDIVSFERIGNFDSNFPETGKIIINEDGGDRYNTDCLLPASTKCAAISNDVVIKLFSNAHWAILPQLSPTGTIRNWFFNTVAADDASAGDVNMLNGVEPKVVIYNFVMKDEATANKFVKDNLDAFIVEPYGAGFMEVHTIPWKTIEVLHEYANGNKDDYSDNYPWAICLPGNDFRYPREWWAITKAYQKSGHSFRRWAKYHTKAQDWYLYPTEEALYK